MTTLKLTFRFWVKALDFHLFLLLRHFTPECWLDSASEELLRCSRHCDQHPGAGAELLSLLSSLKADYRHQGFQRQSIQVGHWSSLELCN